MFRIWKISGIYPFFYKVNKQERKGMSMFLRNFDFSFLVVSFFLHVKISSLKKKNYLFFYNKSFLKKNKTFHFIKKKIFLKKKKRKMLLESLRELIIKNAANFNTATIISGSVIIASLSYFITTNMTSSLNISSSSKQRQLEEYIN